MSGAGQQDHDSQKGEWVALRLDQFPLLPMVSLSDQGRLPGYPPLFHGTGLRSCIGYAGDEPLAAGLHEVEEIGAAVVRFAVDQKLEGRPDHGEVIICSHQRIVNALFQVGLTWLAEVIGKGVYGHLLRLAVSHEHQYGSRQGRGFDGGWVPVRHAVKHGMDRSKHGGVWGLAAGARRWQS